MRAQPKASHFIDGARLEREKDVPFEDLYPAFGSMRETIAPTSEVETVRVVCGAAI